MMSESEFKLKNTPEDGISSVRFAPSSNLLLASSWDGTVRLYDALGNHLAGKYSHDGHAVLDACFQDNYKCWSGGLDNTLKTYDFSTQTETAVGNHNNAIRCVEFCPELNTVVTGSWDSTLKMWDPRTYQCVGSCSQQDTVYTMSLCGDKIVVGTVGRKVLVWDLRNLTVPQQRRESSLKFQTRSIRCFPNKQGYVLSSIEGRVAVEYLDPSPEIQKKKYAFKCHRVKDNQGIECIYPVNAIAFHNGYNTFATGGSDGYVNIWDGFNKKRLCQFHHYHTSVASLSFNHDGTLLAIAASYMYEFDEHPNPLPEDAIFIRRVTDQETKPK